MLYQWTAKSTIRINFMDTDLSSGPAHVPIARMWPEMTNLYQICKKGAISMRLLRKEAPKEARRRGLLLLRAFGSMYTPRALLLSPPPPSTSFFVDTSS